MNSQYTIEICLKIYKSLYQLEYKFKRKQFNHEQVDRTGNRRSTCALHWSAATRFERTGTNGSAKWIISSHRIPVDISNEPLEYDQISFSSN